MALLLALLAVFGVIAAGVPSRALADPSPSPSAGAAACGGTSGPTTIPCETRAKMAALLKGGCKGGGSGLGCHDLLGLGTGDPCSGLLGLGLYSCLKGALTFTPATTCTNGEGSGCTSGGGGLGSTLGGVASDAASGAFDAVAQKFGGAAGWLLQQLGGVFFASSVINLNSDGITPLYLMLYGLSLTVAFLLFCIQVGRTAWTRDGTGLATALTGLAKWAMVCLAMFLVTQTALESSDEISTWLVTSSYPTDQAFVNRLNNAFGSWLTNPASNSALLLIVSLFAIAALLALWLEMLFRHSAIDVLVTASPIAATGEIAVTSKDWWPRTRGALIAMILMKPVIILCLLIGMAEFGSSTSFQSFLVGLMTITLAAFAWPVLAKFFTFTSVGGGSSIMSGLLGAAAGTAASALWSRGGGGRPSGAGALQPGTGAYARALEADNDQRTTRTGSGSGSGGRRSFGGGGATAAIMGAQGLAAGTRALSGGMESMAAHAELGPGQDMGQGISLPPSRSGAEPPALSAARPAVAREPIPEGGGTDPGPQRGDAPQTRQSPPPPPGLAQVAAPSVPRARPTGTTGPGGASARQSPPPPPPVAPPRVLGEHRPNPPESGS